MANDPFCIFVVDVKIRGSHGNQTVSSNDLSLRFCQTILPDNRSILISSSYRTLQPDIITMLAAAGTNPTGWVTQTITLCGCQLQRMVCLTQSFTGTLSLPAVSSCKLWLKENGNICISFPHHKNGTKLAKLVNIYTACFVQQHSCPTKKQEKSTHCFYIGCAKKSIIMHCSPRPILQHRYLTSI